MTARVVDQTWRLDRPYREVVCANEYCRETFLTQETTRKYCSESCRTATKQRAWYWRQK